MTSAFTFPQFSPEQQALAQKVYEHFETLFDRGEDGAPLHRNAAEVIVKHPDYAQARAALGTRCAFAFSGDTYALQSSMVVTGADGKAMSVRNELNGRRIGDCRPDAQ